MYSNGILFYGNVIACYWNVIATLIFVIRLTSFWLNNMKQINVEQHEVDVIKYKFIHLLDVQLTLGLTCLIVWVCLPRNLFFSSNTICSSVWLHNCFLWLNTSITCLLCQYLHCLNCSVVSENVVDSVKTCFIGPGAGHLFFICFLQMSHWKYYNQRST